MITDAEQSELAALILKWNATDYTPEQRMRLELLEAKRDEVSPILTSLSYSGGEQSHGLLEMVLRGHVQRPHNFVVLNADPGMEDSRSYEFVAEAKRRCAEAGIPFVTAKGPNLYSDILMLPFMESTRLDNPPYWVKKPNGKIGRLKQKCTGAYKIAPMQRERRKLLNQMCGISLVTKRIPPVEVWVGFAADESNRITAKKTAKGPKYIKIRYPLVEAGITKAKMVGYYFDHNISRPPRSVCIACFANGLAYLEDMYRNRPNDWDRLVIIDEAVRDLSQIGIKGEVYVSSTCIPIKDLPKLGFKQKDADYREHRCNSGVCFI